MSSERKIVEYKVFALRREEDWEDFENRIKEAIEDGWQPLGWIGIGSNTSKDWFWWIWTTMRIYQAMVKYE